MAADQIEDVLWAMNTCFAENSHFRRLKFLRKDRFYYNSYEARSVLSGMCENLNQIDVIMLVYAQFGLSRDVCMSAYSFP